MRIVTKTNITACPLRSRGKVRDIYDVDEDTYFLSTMYMTKCHIIKILN